MSFKPKAFICQGEFLLQIKVEKNTEKHSLLEGTEDKKKKKKLCICGEINVGLGSIGKKLFFFTLCICVAHL